MTDKFTSLKFNTWTELYSFSQSLSNWFYRGQSNAEWELSSSLEREISINHGSSWNWDHTEKWMLKKFRGFAHNYLSHPPKDNDLLEWLALMQHHGAPTRLLDCTHSLPIATFFAAQDSKSDFAIWAFNYNHFFKTLIGSLNLNINGQFDTFEFNAEMHKKVNEFIDRSASGALVIPSMPPRTNQRMQAQQGLFLFPSDPSRTFQENLGCLIDVDNICDINKPNNLKQYNHEIHNHKFLRNSWFLKLVLPKSERFNTLQCLHKMNIHDATLFPGLDGFARSLKYLTLRDN